jgi:hypothetical protein
MRVGEFTPKSRSSSTNSVAILRQTGTHPKCMKTWYKISDIDFCIRQKLSYMPQNQRVPLPKTYVMITKESVSREADPPPTFTNIINNTIVKMSPQYPTLSIYQGPNLAEQESYSDSTPGSRLAQLCGRGFQRLTLPSAYFMKNRSPFANGYPWKRRYHCMA